MHNVIKILNKEGKELASFEDLPIKDKIISMKLVKQKNIYILFFCRLKSIPFFTLFSLLSKIKFIVLLFFCITTTIFKN